MRARLAAALTLALLAAGCAPAPTASPASSASASAGPSAGQPASPPTMAPSAAALDPDSVPFSPSLAVEVRAETLSVRVEPSGEAQEYGQLKRGDIAVLMVFFPVEVDGAAWWYVEEVRTEAPGKLPELPALLVDPATEFPHRGWVAATDASGETLVRLRPRCPGQVDLLNVSGMLGGERLACFGAAPIRLEGRFSCAGCATEAPGIFEPSWLATPYGGKLVVPAEPDRRVLLWFPPGVTPPTEEQAVRVVGHFDDPAARTCQITEENVPTPPDIAVQLCRAHFVVDAFEPFQP
jgi:hypothetical protein